MPLKVFFSIGDLSASNYIYEIFREGFGHLEIWGITDDKLETIKFRRVGRIEDVSVTGLTEVLPRILGIRKVFRNSLEILKRCDVLIACDAPGFNLPLIKRARTLGVKRIIYFISPQVWAWKRGRAKTIAHYCDHIVVILPFEVEIYRSVGARSVHYEGHPLVDMAVAKISKTDFRERFFGGKTPIAILPGSRWSELRKHLPYLRKVLYYLQKESLIVGIPTFRKFKAEVEKVLGDIGVKVITEEDVNNPAYELMNSSLCGLIASGTASLEASLLGLSHVIFYRISPITYWSARLALRINSINLPNILIGEKLVREMINESPEKTALEVIRLLKDPSLRDYQRERFKRLREILGEKGVIKRLRALFLELLS